MNVMDDFRYAVRLLAKKPGFTLISILVMATGLTLSVFLMSFLHALVLKHLPFKDADTLVQISTSLNGFRNVGMMNLHDYEQVRRHIKGLTEFGAYRNMDVNVSGRDGARRYRAIAAEPNIFRLTRTRPVLGREFAPAENLLGAEPVVVIGYDLWQNQFAGDGDIVGKSLRINAQNYRIIGVMPRDYYFPINAQLWLPLGQQAAHVSRDRAVSVYGLAHLNSTMSEVNRELAQLMKRLAEKYPKSNGGIGAYVEFIPRLQIENGIGVLYAMHVVAWMILALASINVGNLLLSRAVERGKETAIRVALGATRTRVVVLMLWESVIICSAGAVIGLLLLGWALEVSQRVVTTFLADPPFWWHFGLDGFSIKWTLVFWAAAIFVMGFLPAWKNSGADIMAVIRDGTRGGLGKRAGKLNRFLVVGEILISMAVLITAAVMLVGNMRSLWVDYGADPDNIVTAQLSLAGYPSAQRRSTVIISLQYRLEHALGEGNVMFSSALPGEITVKPAVAIQGREYRGDGAGTYPRANHIMVMPGTLSDLGVALRRGRYLQRGLDGPASRSVVVTQSFVSRYFNGESALGKKIRIIGADGGQSDWLSIVGIVEHTIQGWPDGYNRDIPSVFRPYSQEPVAQMTVAIKLVKDAADVVRLLRRTLKSIDPDLPAFRIEPYKAVMDRYNNPGIFISTVFLIFGAAAVILAASGIYAVMSNTLMQRTQEIGIKRALGASEARISGEFLWVGVKQLLWGGIPGLVVGCAMGYVMSELLLVDHSEIFIIASVLAAAIAAVVLLATYLPTARALKMQPVEALRYE